MTVKLYRNARIFTPQDPGHPLRGKEQGKIREYSKGAILAVNGLIEKIGDESEVLHSISAYAVNEERDMGGACVIPGFVDPHTHLCFAKRREDEFKMRLDGLPYLEILKRGGGILSSVNAVKSVTEEELFFATKKLALSALAKGTTTIEIKSGYGLDLELELKMLSVISRISRETPLDVVPTFMGAHAVPVEYKERPDDFVDLIINEMLPKVREQGIAEFCDIFCEEGVFSVAQSRKILNAAREMGFGLKIHADEVHDLGGAGLAAELGVRSAEHLLAAAEENLRAMGRAGSIAVLLPATAYSLKKPYAKGREMIDWEVPVALATDCNPGSCFCESVPFIFGLGVMNMDMTVEEALSAATLNAAYAINRQHKVGSLEPGKQADFLVLDGETPTTLAYHVGSTSVLEVHKLAERVA
ncbi:MAG TPA: imidazolonepropionase [Synergistaceae bacterium]|jgi:imidazolonepropionase|nr:imidazolonepropionase [Synergistaceae bacterium]HPX03384.1 imidazolonepropionase [Synergistaceae bacterium]HQA54399.1 imidazolonepropionase [Synergistaceae bacterium]